MIYKQSRPPGTELFGLEYVPGGFQWLRTKRKKYQALLHSYKIVMYNPQLEIFIRIVDAGSFNKAGSNPNAPRLPSGDTVMPGG